MPVPPTVSVGIPTYNRAASLERSISSVLAQTYSDLELVISDNASTDRTRQLCEEIAERDPRIRYFRQPDNHGLTANINSVFSHCRGRYMMILGDDDWLDDSYLSRCVEILESNPDHTLVSGGARFFRDGELVDRGVEIDLLENSGVERMLSYYQRVADNVFIYGLIRRRALHLALPMPHMIGGDWLLIARVAFLGKTRTVGGTWINRSAEGTSASFVRTASRMGLSEWQGRHPLMSIALHALADAGWRSPAYASVGWLQRRFLGLRCFWAVLRPRSRDVGWETIYPLIRHPRLAWLYRPSRALSRVRRSHGSK